MNNLTQYLEQFVGDVVEPVRGQQKGFHKMIEIAAKMGFIWDDVIEAWILKPPDTNPITNTLSDYPN